jgi:hypothetical protein
MRKLLLLRRWQGSMRPRFKEFLRFKFFLLLLLLRFKEFRLLLLLLLLLKIRLQDFPLRYRHVIRKEYQLLLRKNYPPGSCDPSVPWRLGHVVRGNREREGSPQLSGRFGSSLPRKMPRRRNRGSKRRMTRLT